MLNFSRISIQGTKVKTLFYFNINVLSRFSISWAICFMVRHFRYQFHGKYNGLGCKCKGKKEIVRGGLNGFAVSVPAAFLATRAELVEVRCF